MRSKYGNRKTNLDGITFDSAKEAHRYAELKMMEKCGVIQDLRLQVPYIIQPKFLNKETGRYERAIKYIADFVYIQDGVTVIEDVKSEITHKDKVYRLKKKMMAYQGWYIHEV